MPRQARIKASKRSAIRQQDVFEYGPQVQPKARPVKVRTDVRPQSQAGGALNALAEGLSLIEDTIPLWQRAKAADEKRHKAEGKTAAGRGDKLNEDATEAFIEGYEEITGAGEGYLQLQGILNEVAQKNAGSTLQQFDTQQDQAIKQFFGGRSDAFIRGALPGAISLQKEYRRGHIEKQNAEFEMDKLSKTRSLMESAITQTIKEEPEQLDVALRGVLSVQQEMGKDPLMGHHRSVSTMQMVTLMGNRAVDSANEDLMDFADLKGPGGLRVIDNAVAANKVRQFRESARAELNRREKANEGKAEKAKKDAKVAINVKMTEIIDAIGNPQATEAQRVELIKGAYQMLNEGEDAGMFTRAESSHHRDELADVHGVDGIWAERDNVDRKIQALTFAIQDPEKLTDKYLSELKLDLTRSSYEEVFKAMAATEKRRQTQAHKKGPRELHFDEQRKVSQNIVNKKNPYTNMAMFDKGDERERAFNTQVIKAMRGWLAQNKGKYPDEDQVDEIMAVAVEAAFKIVPQSLTAGVPKVVAESGNGVRMPGAPKVEPQEKRIENLNSQLDGLVDVEEDTTILQDAKESGD
jgi:hypothetical protein